MIYYLLLGLIWTAYIEFRVNVKIEGEPFNNTTRIMNMLIWPVAVVIFISGVIRAMTRKDDEE
jgi:hypothetical protein